MKSLPDTFRITEYKPSHKEGVLMLLRFNTPKYFAASEEADLAYYLDHEREDYFIVETDGLIIGCGGINYANNGTTGKISWDILHPDYQGRSIGSQLLRHRIHLLSSMKNIREITLRTSQLAYRFYEKHGFQLRQVKENYWAEGLDLYDMVLVSHSPSIVK